MLSFLPYCSHHCPILAEDGKQTFDDHEGAVGRHGTL